MRYVVLLLLLLISLFDNAIAWRATLYSNSNFTGDELKVESSICLSLTNKYFCENCNTSAYLEANSIKVENTCLNLHFGESCSEASTLMKVWPGSVWQEDWESYGLKGKVKSVSECNHWDWNYKYFNGLLEGNTTSPNFPNNYPPNQREKLIVTVPVGKKIEMTIHTLDFEVCCDYLAIRELSSDKLIYMGRNQSTPSTFISETNQVYLYFYSDSGRQSTGFNLSWRAVDADQMEKTDVYSRIEIVNSVNPLDSTVETEVGPNVEFITYKRSDTNLALNGREVEFRKDEKNVVYVHGYSTYVLEDGNEIKDAFFQGTDDVYTVTIVDWRKWTLHSSHYNDWSTNKFEMVALKNLPEVANVLKEFLIRKLTNSSNVYLVGFSFGAHLAGTAARNVASETGWVINRISALDPPGYIFEHSWHEYFTVNNTYTLRKSDALFVDVIHASPLLGMNEKVGHLDIFIKESKCNTATCTHFRALETFKASLTSCSYITCPKELIVKRGLTTKQFACNTTDYSQISSLGYLADRYEGRGSHEIYLYDETWTGFSDSGTCSKFLNLPLPAKQRICKNGISDQNGTCYGKPYLTSCSTTDCLVSKSFCSYRGISLNSTNAEVQNLVRNIWRNDAVAWQAVTGCPEDGCRNALNGKLVPYFILYKPPHTGHYAVITEKFNSRGKPLFMSKMSVSDPRSFLGQTLAPIYQRNNRINYVMWNEQPLDSNSDVGNDYEDYEDNTVLIESMRKSKGVLAFSNSSGFLLLHSIPAFPVANGSSYGYPSSGFDEAHIAICITMHADSQKAHEEKLIKIANEMKTFSPNVYESRINTNVDDALKNALVSLKEGSEESPYSSNIIPADIGPFDFTIHTNSVGNWTLEDVAMHYKTDLHSHTGINEENIFESSCDREFSVENVQGVKIKGISWDKIKDQSRWVVSKDERNPLTCIGDLDNAHYNRNNGGMFICTRNNYISSIFREIPTDIDSCPEDRQILYGPGGNRLNSPRPVMRH